MPIILPSVHVNKYMVYKIISDNFKFLYIDKLSIRNIIIIILPNFIPSKYPFLLLFFPRIKLPMNKDNNVTIIFNILIAFILIILKKDNKVIKNSPIIKLKNTYSKDLSIFFK